MSGMLGNWNRQGLSWNVESIMESIREPVIKYIGIDQE